MTILDVREQPQTAPQGSDELEHIVCCVDDDTTMCGLTIGGEVGDKEPTCVVCADLLDRREYYADLLNEDPQEPGDKPCRVCPKLRAEAS